MTAPKIAVVPVNIDILGQNHPAHSETDAFRQLKSKSQNLQRQLYFELEDYLLTTAATNWQLQHFTDTNHRLAAFNYGTFDSWELSPTELADLLGVDAILRVSMTVAGANATWNAGMSPTNTWAAPFADCPIDHWPKETKVEAGLFDGLTGLPRWSVGLGKGVSRGNSHKAIARRLVLDMRVKSV